MKRALFALLLASGLFADFNSLAEEKAFQAEQKQKEEAQKQESKKKFEEIVIPRINNLKAFNDSFYEKYLVKESDTPEMIDQKFKNRAKLYSLMARDIKAAQAEYEALEKVRKNICSETNNYCDLEISKIHRIPISKPYFSAYYNLSLYIEDFLHGSNSYERYLKDAYSSYEIRQKKANEEKEREAQLAEQKKKQSEATVAEQKRAKIVCKEWLGKAKKRVYSLGVGDKIVIRGRSYSSIIEAVHANTFAVRTYLGFSGSYLTNVKKSDCLPYDAPSGYCYQ